MNSWHVASPGSPETALKAGDGPVPPPHADDLVEVAVERAAVSYPDLLLVRGEYQDRPAHPFTPGVEGAGRVVRAPSGSGLAEGDRVAVTPRLPWGTFAERCWAPPSWVFPVPDAMTMSQSAAFAVSYQTAWLALKVRARVAPGEWVLVHAGSGALGSAVIQVAKACGARVIAGARSAAKRAACVAAGADEVIDYDDSRALVTKVRHLTGGAGVDIVADPVGEPVAELSRRSLAVHGRWLVLGFAGGSIPAVPLNHVLLKNYSVIGVNWALYRDLPDAPQQSWHRALVEMWTEGRVAPVIHPELFDDPVSAFSALTKGAAVGKVVTRVAGPIDAPEI